jgi:hypothetical protein
MELGFPVYYAAFVRSILGRDYGGLATCRPLRGEAW